MLELDGQQLTLEEVARVARGGERVALAASARVRMEASRPPDETRAMMLLRANVLAKGFSGARVVVAETLLAMLARNVVPVVPEKVSVGASGDLAPLSHLALCCVGEGEAFYEGERMPGGDALRRAGVEPLRLE